MQLPESRVAELKGLHKSRWTGLEFQRFLCIWLRVERGLSAVEIAEVVGWHPNTVRVTQRDFIAYGLESFHDRRNAGGRPRLLSPEDEKDFLAGFECSAGKGLLVVAGEIKIALERKLGREVHTSTVYRMLSRHKWRKVKPRPRHPKQDTEAVAAFKKGASQTG
jgi:transposase